TQRRALELMLLGDFETAGFAGSKRRHSVPAPAGRRLRSLARQKRVRSRRNLHIRTSSLNGQGPAI
ncbi:MAG: hypothetical protein ABF639_08760, partial [Lacticaseibacillus paracasei]